VEAVREDGVGLNPFLVGLEGWCGVVEGRRLMGV